MATMNEQAEWAERNKRLPCAVLHQRDQQN